MSRMSSVAELERRIRDVELENSNLAALYVAMGQLHASLEVREVLAAIVEILLNFVGAEHFAVIVPDGAGELRAIASHGVALADIPAGRIGEGTVGRTMQSGEAEVRDYRNPRPVVADMDGPVVCIPLRAAGEVMGVLPIWGFLQQKTAFDDIDHEIFLLMGTSAGVALEAARLAMTAREVPVEGYYEAFSALIG